MISITNNLTKLDGIMIDSIKDYQSKYIELMNIAFDKAETIKDMHGNVFVKQKVDTQVESEHRTTATEAPDRPKGKWILIHPLQEDDDGAYMCSCCNVGNWGIDPKIDNFCFNCGADMRGEEDGVSD